MPPWTELALHADSAHNGGRLRGAAQHLGLTVLDVPRDPADLRFGPRPGLAWRAPVGLAAYLVEGEPWSPLLHRHRASFHDEAAAFAADVLSDPTGTFLLPASSTSPGCPAVGSSSSRRTRPGAQACTAATP